MRESEKEPGEICFAERQTERDIKASLEKMIEISDSDLRSLENFSLKWRWTDERWNKLPPASLTQINPLTAEKCREIWEIQKQYLFPEGLGEEFFEKTEMIRTDTAEESEISKWLASRMGDEQEAIIVLWNKKTAVKTTSKIFCNYWDDFCYPASDDVSISPLNLSWLLIHHHDEYFCFGKLKEEFIR
jgi:hypothetical protein